MPNFYNIEVLRGRPIDLVTLKDCVDKFVSSCALNDSFVYSGISSATTDGLLSHLKSFREDYKNIRPHFIAISAALNLLMFRVYYELPDKVKDQIEFSTDLKNPLLLATWYLYRMNAFRGTKIPMIRIGDHARLFFTYFIVNILDARQMELEKEVISLINQTKWKYLSPRIISIREK